MAGGGQNGFGENLPCWQCVAVCRPFFFVLLIEGHFSWGNSELQEKSRTPKCEARDSKSAGIIGKYLQNVEICPGPTVEHLRLL